MKKRILAISLSLAACVSLLAVPVSAVVPGSSNDTTAVVESAKPAEVLADLKADTKSTKPVEVASVTAADGAALASIEIIPANAPAAAKMTAEELTVAIKTITDAVSSVSGEASATASAAIASIQSAVATAIVPISFSVDATFAFPVEVSVNVGKETASGAYKLYYVDAAGKVTLAGDATVGNDGMAKFTLTHCSDYFLSSKTLTDNVLSAAGDVAAAKTPTADENNPSTGNTAAETTVAIVSLLALAACGIVIVRKRATR